MFGLVLLINIAAVAANWNGDLRTGAVISGVAALWSFGVASNYGADRFSIPNYAAQLSILAGLGGIIFLVLGLAT